ncbi:hypothetical protein GN109_10915 [Collimonas pratensis]|uniref:hypothetical protein n=1 Tax=Collimonas pratensis TaxID=279113 RepID=UPI00143D412F|nr:hypothetical protein [Collimonas pratensis]NKI69932.1 hypothetical protein [Collimonas pratensis]
MIEFANTGVVIRIFIGMCVVLGLLIWVPFAIIKPKSTIFKMIWIAAVLALLSYPAVRIRESSLAEERLAAIQKANLDYYKMRCKSAGEKITKTVDNVDGVFLMKIRPQRINGSDQFALDDPYGLDLGDDEYIKNFLKGRDEQGGLVYAFTAHPGYHYVEAVDPKDGSRYRYTAYIDEIWKRDSNYLQGVTHFELTKAPPLLPGPRYGVTYDDISTPEDRKRWIAGSSLRVIDLQTNEVIAERIGYMIDPGLGNRSGGRAPWLLAAYRACPAFPPIEPGRTNSVHQFGQTRRFVEKVLQPIQEQS